MQHIKVLYTMVAVSSNVVKAPVEVIIFRRSITEPSGNYILTISFKQHTNGLVGLLGNDTFTT